MGTQTKNKKYKLITILTDINNITDIEAYTKFNTYKSDGIILTNDYNSCSWFCCDDVGRRNIYFDIDSNSYSKYLNYTKIDYIDFIHYLKKYAIYYMGKLALISIIESINAIKSLILIDPELITEQYKISNYFALFRVREFFEIINRNNNQSIENIINSLDEVITKHYSKKKSKQRLLASYFSYFTFDSLIKKFWNETNDEELKMFYAPIYYWWMITAVIPLRPIEFVLMPRDCLKLKDGKWYLTLRRNNLKGRNNISYKIHDDYYLTTYEIPESLAVDLNWYISRAKELSINEIDTLFVRDSHYDRWSKCIPINTRYFTYTNLNTVLKMFYSEIICGKYDYSIVYDKHVKYLEDKKIQLISLGDTRHLAFVNILSEGFAPYVAKLLGGHESIEMSSHYFSNIVSMIECQVYLLYRKATKGQQAFCVDSGLPVPIENEEYVFLDDGSKCYSKHFKKGEITDCKNAIGSLGELSNCNRCRFHQSLNAALFFENNDEILNQLEVEYKSVILTTNAYRNGAGKLEDITSCIMRFQESIFTYKEYLIQKEMVKNGKNKN